jgi:hypothetical protein
VAAPLEEDPLEEDPLEEDPLEEDPLEEDPLEEDPLAAVSLFDVEAGGEALADGLAWAFVAGFADPTEEDFLAATGSPADARSFAMTDCSALSPADPEAFAAEDWADDDFDDGVLDVWAFAAGFAGCLPAGLADALAMGFSDVSFGAATLAAPFKGGLTDDLEEADCLAFVEAGLVAAALGEVAFVVLLPETFFTAAIRYAPSR